MPESNAEPYPLRGHIVAGVPFASEPITEYIQHRILPDGPHMRGLLIPGEYHAPFGLHGGTVVYYDTRREPVNGGYVAAIAPDADEVRIYAYTVDELTAPNGATFPLPLCTVYGVPVRMIRVENFPTIHRWV
jgi:hypothetical protein